MTTCLTQVHPPSPVLPSVTPSRKHSKLILPVALYLYIHTRVPCNVGKITIFVQVMVAARPTAAKSAECDLLMPSRLFPRTVAQVAEDDAHLRSRQADACGAISQPLKGQPCADRLQGDGRNSFLQSRATKVSPAQRRLCISGPAFSTILLLELSSHDVLLPACHGPGGDGTGRCSSWAHGGSPPSDASSCGQLDLTD